MKNKREKWKDIYVCFESDMSKVCVTVEIDLVWFYSRRSNPSLKHFVIEEFLRKWFEEECGVCWINHLRRFLIQTILIFIFIFIVHWFSFVDLILVLFILLWRNKKSHVSTRSTNDSRTQRMSSSLSSDPMTLFLSSSFSSLSSYPVTSS